MPSTRDDKPAKATDVTEVEQVRRALSESQLRLQAALECGGICTWVWDIPRNRVQFDDSAIELLGLTAQEAAEATPDVIAKHVHPEDRPRFDAGVAEILAGDGGDRELEYRICRPDGSVLWVAGRGRLEFDETGSPRRMIGACIDISSQKRAEAAPRESEQHFRRLSESAFEGLMIHEQGIVRDANQAFAELFGFATAGELIGKPCVDVAPLTPESKQVIREQLRRPRAEPFEVSATFPDGSRRVLETQGREIVYQGRSARVAAMRDVTERKRAEEALRESDERFRNAFEFAAVGMAILNLDGRWLRVNRALCNILGYTEEELLAREWQSLTHPDDLPGDLERNRQIVAGEIPCIQADKRYIHKDGRVVWAFLSVSLVRDARGNPLYFIAQTQDFTARRQAEDNLRKQQNYLHDLALASPAAICLFRRRPDGTSCMPYASRGLEAILGLQPEELANDIAKALALVHSGDRDMLEASVVESMQSMSLWRCEFRILHLTKGERWVEGSSVPSRDADGGTSWYGYITDVTERKRLEEQLRHSQKMEAVGRLARGIAHDFNNLLTVINGHARLLLDRTEHDDPRHGGLTAIDDAGRRAAALVRQLLAFSRGQALQPVEVDLNEVIRSSESLIRGVIGERIELRLNCTAGLGTVRTDCSQMEQVLMNLVVNARDAMPDGGKLVIETSSAELTATQPGPATASPNRRFVQLSVTDTGEGMSSDVVSRIFEPFFTTKEFGKGTGLGLSVVHGIVTQGGGYIDVKSTLGEGSTFTILLPASKR